MELSLILKLRFMTESHLCGWIRKHCELIVAVSYRDPAKFENVKAQEKASFDTEHTCLPAQTEKDITTLKDDAVYTVGCDW